MNYVHELKPNSFISKCNLDTGVRLPDNHSWSYLKEEINCPFCEKGQMFEDRNSLDLLLGVNERKKSEKVPERKSETVESPSSFDDIPDIPDKTLDQSLKEFITSEEAQDLYEVINEEEKQRRDLISKSVIKSVDKAIRYAIKQGDKEFSIELYHTKNDWDLFLRDFYDLFLDVLTDKGYNANYSLSKHYNDPVRAKINILIEG